jgi:hypothetical protein
MEGGDRYGHRVRSPCQGLLYGDRPLGRGAAAAVPVLSAPRRASGGIQIRAPGCGHVLPPEGRHRPGFCGMRARTAPHARAGRALRDRRSRPHGASRETDEPWKRVWARDSRERVRVHAVPASLLGVVQLSALRLYLEHARPLAKRALQMLGKRKKAWRTARHVQTPLPGDVTAESVEQSRRAPEARLAEA